MKKYNIINNSLGWLCFVIAAVTYLLTLEPTASFWDCPEFILQGAKLEIGHPPGNPIFMLAARFFITLFGNDMQTAAIAVNSMSALLSAGTILLLFWTITHLVRKLIVPDDASEISATRTALIMGAGLCGALAYTWSDTFWFSAVEGEVYAFSSFCTALVFWLILKWENRADQPHSDRYLLLIAYIIGISIAVHLLNLLCIPAIGLVIYYRKFKKVNAVGSLIALAISCAVVGVILFGMVPGVMKMSQWFERLFVNGLGTSFNVGVLVYAIILLAVLIWSVVSFYRQRSAAAMKWSFFLGVLLSGVLLIGHSAVLPVLLLGGLGVWLAFFCKQVPVRILNLIITSILVIFIGYSSYALLLIRSNANTPMNQQSPDNVFTLASYLNREQYGSAPLLYGPTIIDQILVQGDERGEYMFFDRDGQILTVEQYTGRPTPQLLYNNDGYPVTDVSKQYAKKVKNSPGEADEYVEIDGELKYKYLSEAEVFFPRMYSYQDNSRYRGWAEIPGAKVPQSIYDQFATEEHAIDMGNGEVVYVVPMELAREELEAEGISRQVERYVEPAEGTEIDMIKTPYKYNLAYFLGYQLNHMYWRYFMWNFAGRQNDIAGNGEPHQGNWISGIPFIDNARLGDQSLLPEEYGTGNKGHNVFYMLPLLLGVIGLLWQSLCRHAASADRGIQQFWVVFFLFFMTGIAIVLYLNQTPGQPRERDYAFAGSFYAFAIWIGMGVPAIGIWLKQLLGWLSRKGKDSKPMSAVMRWCAAVPALLIGIAVPLQMVSQTWDDHDRSGRYTARDFGMNYLSSVEPDGIIFTYGDNDTFPLWYAQEVEGYRTDVKVINLSYFTSDWYVNSLRMPHHGSKPIELMATPQVLAYRPLMLEYSDKPEYETVDAITAFKDYYSQPSVSKPKFKYPNFYIASDSVGAVKAFDMAPGSLNYELGFRNADMNHNFSDLEMTPYQHNILTYDLVALNAANGWKRPIYFATTVPERERSGFDRYSYLTGMAEQVTPFENAGISPTTDKAYRNILEKFRWGGLDRPDADKLYLDETVRRMVMSTRGAILKVAADLINTGDLPASDWAVSHAKATGRPVPANRYDMARELINTVETKLSTKAMARYNQQVSLEIQLWLNMYQDTGNKADLAEAREILDEELPRYAKIYEYAKSLGDKQYKLAYGELRWDLDTYQTLLAFKDEIEKYENGNAD